MRAGNRPATISGPDPIFMVIARHKAASAAFDAEIAANRADDEAQRQARVRHLAALQNVEVPPPILVMLSGARMLDTIVADRHYGRRIPKRPFPPEMKLPAIIIADFGDIDHYRGALKPIFDAIWNAGGYERSLSYTADGTWQRTR
jgi:hypothetical protein